MEEGLLVLSVKSYNFMDGLKTVAGLNVEYITPEVTAYSAGKRGVDIIKIRGDLTMESQFPVVPGIYNMSFGTKPDGKGRPMLYLKAAEYVGGVQFQKVG